MPVSLVCCSEVRDNMKSQVGAGIAIRHRKIRILVAHQMAKIFHKILGPFSDLIS